MEAINKNVNKFKPIQSEEEFIKYCSDFARKNYVKHQEKQETKIIQLTPKK